MPYFAKKPFSFATMSGAESVSAMKPRIAFVVSGVPVAAYSGFGSSAPSLVAAAAAPAALMSLPARNFLVTHRYLAPTE